MENLQKGTPACRCTPMNIVIPTKCYENWVVPAGVPSALAAIRSEAEANY